MKFDAPTADEFPLVFDAWARSFKKSPWAGCVPNHLWDSVSRAMASEIINRGAEVTVACIDLPEGGRRVMGYAVTEPGVLHWLFVKRDYRGMGVGRALLAQSCPGDGAMKYTCRTRASTGFLGSRFSWDPVPARVREPRELPIPFRRH